MKGFNTEGVVDLEAEKLERTWALNTGHEQIPTDEQTERTRMLAALVDDGFSPTTPGALDIR